MITSSQCIRMSSTLIGGLQHTRKDLGGLPTSLNGHALDDAAGARSGHSYRYDCGADPDSGGHLAEASRARAPQGQRPPPRAVERAVDGMGRGGRRRTHAARRPAAAVARSELRQDRIAPRRLRT